jgi:transposase
MSRNADLIAAYLSGKTFRELAADFSISRARASQIVSVYGPKDARQRSQGARGGFFSKNGLQTMLRENWPPPPAPRVDVERDRRIMELRAEGVIYREIAELMDLTMGTVGGVISREKRRGKR